MIKGKKIADVSVKVVASSKDNNKCSAITLGKAFKPEKVELVTCRPIDQRQNEEDLEYQRTNQVYQEEKCDRKIPETVEGPFQAKQVSKVDRKDEKKSRNVTRELKQTKNKSMDRLQCKKQNKMMNSKPNKDMKQTVKKITQAPKILNKQINKDNKVAKQPQQVKLVEEKVVQVFQRETTYTKLDELEESRNQFLDKEDEVEDCEEQRGFQPAPIIDDNILQQVEISFQNNDFELKMPDAPIQYQNSSSEDESQQEDSTIYQPTTRQLVYERQNPFPSELERELSSELFLLSADELLKKEYFNI